MKLSVILPTCKRPTILKSMLNSLISTTQDYDVEIITLIDNDLKSAEIAIERAVHDYPVHPCREILFHI